MTATLVDEVPIDVADDLTRAREVVATARSDAHVALIAHTALLTVETLAQQIERVQAQIATDRREWGDWITFAIERSAEVADDNEWCEVYDRTMERLGLPPRSPQEVEVDWRCVVTLRQEVDDDDVERLVRNQIGNHESITVSTSAYVDVEVEVTGSTTATDGDCVCGSVDDEDIRANLPSWAESWDIEDGGSVSCDNG